MSKYDVYYSNNFRIQKCEAKILHILKFEDLNMMYHGRLCRIHFYEIPVMLKG